MKTILTLIVGLMLAGCGSMENHLWNHGVASTSRSAFAGSRQPYCGGHHMRLPLTIDSGHSQKC
jgi:hypothetical protein